MAFLAVGEKFFIMIFIGDIVFKTRKWGNKEMEIYHLDKKEKICKNVGVFFKKQINHFY